MKIALGSDHRGIEALNGVETHLEALGHEVTVLGDCDPNGCDYPDQAFVVGQAVARSEFDRGVLICGSGVGVCMAANKIPGIRAALVFDEVMAELSRRHNDANVLCLSGEMTPPEQMRRIIDCWLAAPFDGGRHARRVNKITMIERGEDPATFNPASQPIEQKIS